MESRTRTEETPPVIFHLKEKEGTGCDESTPTPPIPPPPLPRPHSNTLPSHPMPPLTERIGRAQKKLGMGKGTSKGRYQDRADRARRKRCRALKEEKERTRGTRIIVVVRSPCQENYPADAHPRTHKSVLEPANPAWTRSVHLDAPGQRHRQQPVSGTAGPGDTFGPTEGQNDQWREANRHRQMQTTYYRGLVPTPPPSLPFWQLLQWPRQVRAHCLSVERQTCAAEVNVQLLQDPCLGTAVGAATHRDSADRRHR